MTNNKLEADPKKEFCSNPNCRDYGKRGEGNIVRYGHDKNGRQRFKFLIRYVGLTKVQVDEMWSFVKKNKRTLTEEMVTMMDRAIAGYT